MYREHLIYKGYEVQNTLTIEGGIILEATKDGINQNISYFRGPHIPAQAFEGTENILLTFNTDNKLQDTIIMNLRTLEVEGDLTPLAHDLRDLLRRYGIRFFGPGFFRSLPPQIDLDLES